jgi:hypothetical protein
MGSQSKTAGFRLIEVRVFPVTQYIDQC